MNDDIDITKITGDSNEQAAAVQAVETNSYLENSNEEYPAPATAQAPVPQEPSKQELNFAALRDEVDRLKASRDSDQKNYELQLDMMRANLAHQKQPAQEATPKKMFDSMRDDDIPNVSEIRNELRREWETREQAYQSRLEELEVSAKHHDYAEVIEKYALPLIKDKPHLAEGIHGARNKAMFAYELGKMAQELHRKPEPTRPSENAQRIVDNARKPGTLSQAGGQGALSKADYYASMSDQEFAEFSQKQLDRI